MTVVAVDGREFKTHSFTIENRLGSLWHANAGANKDVRRIELTESSDVVERMLQWAYYVDWPDATAVLNIGTEIVTLMHLAIAVDKYDLKKMSDLTLARAQILIDGLRYSKQCMQLIRDFSAAKAVNGSILAKLAVRLEQLIEAESSRQQEGISLLRKEIKFGIRAEDLRGKTV